MAHASSTLRLFFSTRNAGETAWSNFRSDFQLLVAQLKSENPPEVSFGLRCDASDLVESGVNQSTGELQYEMNPKSPLADEVNSLFDTLGFEGNIVGRVAADGRCYINAYSKPAVTGVSMDEINSILAAATSRANVATRKPAARPTLATTKA